MKDFFKGLKGKAQAFAERVESQNPEAMAKLGDLSRQVQRQAQAARVALDEKSSAAKMLAQQVVAAERTQQVVTRVSAGMESVKKSLAQAKEGESPRHAAPAPGVDDRDKITAAIDKLRGRDKAGVSAEGLGAIGGAAAGVAAAGTVAGLAGATTLLGSTGLASVFGGIFVVATPVGWVLGTALVAGAAGYGLTKLARSGANQDRVRKEIVDRLTKRLESLRDRHEAQTALIELTQLVAVALAAGLISDAQGRRMVDLVERGSLDVKVAAGRLKAMAMAEGVIVPTSPA